MTRSLQKLLVTGLILVASASSAFAQRPQQTRYSSPYGPTLPLQLNYFRNDVGVLDPYNTFVNPSSQLQHRLRSIENQQIYDEKATQSAFKKLMSKPAQASQTGKGATFMNYSHYFQTR